MSRSPLALYLHVPFCDGKCPYCDFYSLPADNSVMDRYIDAMEQALAHWSATLCRPVHSVYLGGGTPSQLGPRRLLRLLKAVFTSFSVLPSAEVTMEANPTRDLSDIWAAASAGGVNRASIGLQSSNPKELQLLGRRHTADQAFDAVIQARKAGIQNVSLDLMLALPGQGEQEIGASVAFCKQCRADHVSAYLLKIEEGTPFARQRDSLTLPDDDRAADLYLFACEALEQAGYRQYEISNFAHPGREGQHNLTYWRDEEYLGLGPGAHSFIENERFYYPRDLTAFLRGDAPTKDGSGGSLEECVMLALRLREGIARQTLLTRYGQAGDMAYTRMARRASPFQKAGLIQVTGDHLSLTPKGFLVSNELISELLL